MKQNARKNYLIYILMMVIFGGLIYVSLDMGEKFGHPAVGTSATGSGAFEMFRSILSHNLVSPLAILLFQIIVILIAVRLFSYLFKYLGQPGVMGEIVAGIVLGPSLLGYFFPDFFGILFRPDSLMNLNLLSQIGLVLFMFVIGMELDFSVLKNKMNETLVISHAGIVVPFFLGTVVSFWVYENYASHHTDFLPFALFIGISMSITAFPVLARIVQERGLTQKHVGILSIASAANDDVTAWCLLAVVIAIAKAGTFVSALYTIGLTLLYIALMFLVVRPFLKKIGNVYANSEVINKSFVAFIFVVLVTSSVATEIIGIHALFGAFIAGVVMPPNLGFRKVMMEKVEDIALVFFLPLFFAFTGLRTEIGLLNSPALWGVCALFVLVAVLGKLGGCALAARVVGETWKDSFIIGTLMNTRGLMELVALNIGYEMGVLPPSVFVMLVIMALVTTFMTTPLLGAFEKIFAVKKTAFRLENKVMLSFGRPETGKVLLSLIHFLFGKRLESTDVIAAHFTLGTDLNPAKAEQYARDSFSMLHDEAERLGVSIDERYKVTDKLIYEIAQLAREERVRFLFVGAGQQFMREQALGLASCREQRSFPGRWLGSLTRSTYNLPGPLHREKIEKMMRQVDCPVAIFVNRNFSRLTTCYLILDGESDLFLLPYAGTLLNLGVEVHLSGVKSFHEDESLEQRLAGFASGYADRLFLDPPVADPGSINGRHNLVLVSYETCSLLATRCEYFEQLPSLLVIQPGKDIPETEQI